MSIARTAWMLLALVILVTSYPNRSSGEAEGSPIRCSVVNLLATPAVYDGKRVQLVGYVRLRFEGKVKS